MKDKLIFIISLVIVLFGISYLGYTAYKFFNRNTSTNTNSGSSNTPVIEKKDVFSVKGSTNKDIIAENLNKGDQVSLKIELENPTDVRADYNYEGRVYKVEGIYTFPNTDSQIPINVFAIPVTLDKKSSNEYVYPYTVEECGDYFMSIASADYWKQGKGNMAYGYFNVNCSDTTSGTGGLTSSDTTRTKSSLADKVLGTTTKGGQVVSELPKAGPAETLSLLGAALLGIGFVYNLRLGKVVSN